MKLSELIERNPDGEILKLWLERIPYAKFLGVQATVEKDDILFTLPAQPMLVGNPTMPAIHGGIIGAFMELAAIFHLMAKMEKPAIPKIINFSLDYLRPTRLQDTYAKCTIARQGKSIANLSVITFQDEDQTPTATARIHILLEQYE